MRYLRTYENFDNMEPDVVKVLEQIKKSPLVEDLRNCTEIYHNWNYEKNDGYDGHRLLYHTIRGEMWEDFHDYETINHLKRSKPSDTPQPLHNYVSKKIVKNIGWNPREDAIFVHNAQLDTGGLNYSDGDYGEQFIIFPLGDYKMAWVELVEDMYSYLNDNFYIYTTWQNWWDKFPTIDENGELQEPDHSTKGINKIAPLDDVKDEIYKIYDFLAAYGENIIDDGKLCNWLGNRIEGMLKAEQYIIIDMKYEQDIIDYIWGKK